DLEKNYFAVPDQIVVSRNFTVAKNTTRELGHMASVVGSAEIIRGASHMMYYFRDWVLNGYDQGLAKEQYQGFEVFPKDSFYALSAGVSSVPLRNLTRSGLMAYTFSGVEKDGSTFDSKPDYSTEECPSLDSSDPIISAALFNVSP